MVIAINRQLIVIVLFDFNMLGNYLVLVFLINIKVSLVGHTLVLVLVSIIVVLD